ncbi:LCP family protein [Angustibacter sp. McL0619]|uniref:LCP family protein n=1 Tax=Angustibacter sp. McL0619 TaxID=3415676 RepID=UPI003CFB3A47
MPRTSSPKHRGAPARSGSARQRGRHASSYGDGFGRFAGITTLALLPGAGLIATGRRRFGFLLLLLAGLALAALTVVALSGGVVEKALTVAVSPDSLLAVAVVAMLVGAVWCLTILATAWRARPERPSPFQGVVGLVLVFALCALVAAPSAKGAQLAMVQRDLVTSVFADQGASQPADAAKPKAKAKDPWQDVPRVNMLLIGSDAGADRTGVRSDSMMVASINTKTGDTVLIGLPRNLQNVPFPESNPLHAVWPNGFNCGNECLLNAVWQQAAAVHPDLFHGDPNPGLTTTRAVIGEVLGLRIDGYTIVNMAGFQGLVDAMGGVVVNVPRDIPIGGHDSAGNNVPIAGYVKAGRHRLNGYHALWFSRSRLDSDDYDRMRRQRCMVSALVDQTNPVRLLGQYTALAQVLKDNFSTDIKQDQLKAWVTLVERIQKGKITSLPLTSKVINTVHPDFEQIRSYVAQSVDPAKPSKTSKPTSTATASGTATKTPNPTSTELGSTDSTSAQDVSSVC